MSGLCTSKTKVFLKALKENGDLLPVQTISCFQSRHRCQCDCACRGDIGWGGCLRMHRCMRNDEALRWVNKIDNCRASEIFVLFDDKCKQDNTESFMHPANEGGHCRNARIQRDRKDRRGCHSGRASRRDGISRVRSVGSRAKAAFRQKAAVRLLEDDKPRPTSCAPP